MCTNTSKWAIETGRGGGEETSFCFAHQMCVFAERDNSETVCLFWLERKPWNIIYYILYTWYAEGIHSLPPLPPPPPKKNLIPNPWKTSHYIPCPCMY